MGPGPFKKMVVPGESTVEGGGWLASWIAWLPISGALKAGKTGFGNRLISHKVFDVSVQAAPGIADSVRKRDDGAEWTRACLGSLNK